MGFTRSFLRATGLSDEQITAVIEEHTAVTDALKGERDKYKAEAEKVADLQKQLEGLQGGENWQEKFNKEHEAFENFKKQAAQDAEAARVKAAYRKLLADEKIGEKRIDSILKVTDLSGMKLDKDGKLVGEEDIRKSINDEWSDFKTTLTEKGVVVEKPPQTGKATKTKEEIFAIKDTAERQKAIAENHELFGF